MTSPEKPIDNTRFLRNLPSVDELMDELRQEADGEAIGEASGAALAEVAREAIEIERRRILAGGSIDNGDPSDIRAALRDNI
ncbi:MAG: hypothetical protein HOG04_13600, partial [Nitrospinaceae bacterium]|nr:hypothetical protein [Nitrospinaceae bacterium]